MTTDLNTVKDLLLEDYRYRAEAFGENEQLGERRINLFIAFSGALLTLVGFAVKDDKTPNHRLEWFVLTLFVLCILGGMTLFRLIIRDDRTDECKRDLDAIRQTFKNYAAADGLLLGYFPIAAAAIRTSSDAPRDFGGLSHLMMTINSLLIGSLITALTALVFGLRGTNSVSPVWEALLAMTAFVASLRIQIAYVNHRRADTKAQIANTRTTHAGGVVYRIEDGVPKYLLIRPTRDNNSVWVLPKGHIESNEEHVTTARREVQEEAAAVAQIVCFVGSVNYEVVDSETPHRCEHVRVSFFLMEWLSDSRV